ncbi:hypothetical protein [Sinomonas sp. ASV322]|uniref:hypothetical protein n=1 Tax=Sinomonas sp. ASV322 TaxID=3041920 RepID=UPI0027DD39F8|nr:hypothetical protein [Sinomonas sp. ASV322]MDQ4502988.1 hypothetical protein [Sinomonas sp. ASV322]
MCTGVEIEHSNGGIMGRPLDWGSGDQFREYDLPIQIRGLRMPRWAGVSLGVGLLVVAVAAIAGSILVNERDSTIIAAWAEALIFVGAITAAIVGALLLWRAGEWVTLTREAAIVTKAFRAQDGVDRTQLEDFHAYLHEYAARGGVQCRMVPTFTVREWDGQLRDLPLTFLAYWNPAGGTEAPLPPRAAYIEAWARTASSPYSRTVLAGNVPYALAMHRNFARFGLQRRARLAAVLIPLISIGLGLVLGFGLGPASRVLGGHHSFDAQTNRTGIRDLDDKLNPAMTGYEWRARQTAPDTRDFTFFPTLRSLPSAPFTVHYFIRDPAQRGADLSVPEQKYGRIVSQGIISVKNPTIEFALDHDDTVFSFEIYVTDDHGHTTFNSDLYRNIAGNPTPPS